jgi:hypothetical protein
VRAEPARPLCGAAESAPLLTNLAAVSELVSAVRKDGRPVVRLRCADYGDEWVVECDVYPVDELSVAPRSTGPYRFGSAGEAKTFVETSLLALQMLGCPRA